MSKVIIAEKPSVARNIAEAVGAKKKNDGYLSGEGFFVTWAFGHLVELKDAKAYDERMASWRLEHYPFIPETFEYQIKASSENRQQVDEGAKKQLAIIEKLIALPETTEVISATDYDREGQIIGDLILDFLQVKKPIYRLLLNEWTKAEVLRGLEQLKPNEALKPLKNAGISRQWSDWMIGINLTSVATLKYQRGNASKVLNVGRVLMPTLKIIYDRDMEIEQFVPETFFKLLATFSTDALSEESQSYEAVYTIDDEDRFSSDEVLKQRLQTIKNMKASIIDKQVEQKREYPQSLFNLSNLQGYITAKEKGWTSEKVLKVAQSLYEKKVITYPRTASIALEESLVDKAKHVLDILKKGHPYESQICFVNTKRVFDNSKVESHSAIIPTYVRPKGLSPDEMKVYEAVKNRFLMQFMPVAIFEEGTLVTKVQDDAPGVFITKGRLALELGWKVLENIQTKDKLLPTVQIGMDVTCVEANLEKKETSAPKKHTEKSLLRVMETCGKKYKETDEDEMIAAILSGFSIGTPATRAETISKLKQAGYIEAKGKTLTCTEMGKRMVELFPIKTLFDLEYTGRLEKSLSEIGKGNEDWQAFVAGIDAFTRDAVACIKKDAFHIIGTDLSEEKNDQEVLGKCPNCGSNIVEREKGYGCTNWKGGCKYIIWKNDRFLTALKVKATRQTIIKLLENGSVYSNQLTSKSGKKFSAKLVYVLNEETGYYQWQLIF